MVFGAPRVENRGDGPHNKAFFFFFFFFPPGENFVGRKHMGK